MEEIKLLLEEGESNLTEDLAFSTTEWAESRLVWIDCVLYRTQLTENQIAKSVKDLAESYLLNLQAGSPDYLFFCKLIDACSKLG